MNKMPYNTLNDIPEYVKKYSNKVKSQWRKVFNSVYEKILKETNDVKQSEKRAFLAANSILTKRMINNHEKHSSDQFNFLIDKWLKNM
jgi:cation transport regulator ChaB